jgi:hypothetical protein
MMRQCSDTNNCEQQYNKPTETAGCGLQNALVENGEGNNILLWAMVGTSLALLLSLVVLARLKK